MFYAQSIHFMSAKQSSFYDRIYIPNISHVEDISPTQLLWYHCSFVSF